MLLKCFLSTCLQAKMGWLQLPTPAPNGMHSTHILQRCCKSQVQGVLITSQMCMSSTANALCFCLQSGLVNKFPFDPLGLDSPTNAEKEIKNGRLAMVGCHPTLPHPTPSCGIHPVA